MSILLYIGDIDMWILIVAWIDDVTRSDHVKTKVKLPTYS